VAGRVVRRSAHDTLAAAGARVVLHRVSREASGVIDSTRAEGNGRFRFQLRPDTTFVYLLSARWSGIEYFSEPLPGSSLTARTTLTLLVADTTSRGSATTAGRFLILGAPGATRERRVVDLFVIRNGGTRTLVGSSREAPTWRAPLPRGISAPAVGGVGSDISTDAVRFTDDSVLVLAPLAPGEKQLLLEYAIPAATTRLELDPVTSDSMQVVAEEAGVTVTGLTQAGAQVLDGRPYSRWSGADAGPVLVSFPVAGRRDSALIPLVLGVLLIMTAAAFAAVRFRARIPPPPPPSSQSLATRIARLDAVHGGQQLSAREEQRYQTERAALKRELAEALRREGSRDGL